MNRLWWQLPGPAQLVSTIVQDLHDGKNVLILLPRHMPRGFSSAIRSALSPNSSSTWYSIHPEKEKPIDVLSSYFENDFSQNGRRTAGLSSNNENTDRKIIWLNGIEAAEWGPWEDFFSHYGETSQHASLGRTPVFCVPLTASSALSTMPEPFWSQYYWRGVVGSTDMILFTASMLQERTWSLLQKRVATSVIAGLALWDPEVCQRLAAADFQEILEPKRILTEIASERNWNHQSYDLPRWMGWQEGMEDIIDKKWMTHSALLALGTSSQEIERRIWRAELPVLLPLVEEARQAILREYGDSLRVPWPNSFQTVNDLYDLEINHITSQIKKGIASMSVDSERLILELTEIRNRLSHLRTITFEMLDSDVLNDFVKRQWEQDIEELSGDFEIN